MQFTPGTGDSNSERTCHDQYCDKKSFVCLQSNLLSILIFPVIVVKLLKNVLLFTDASQSPQVCSTSPPKTWSVVEVVKFIEKSELAEHADMFRKHVST